MTPEFADRDIDEVFAGYVSWSKEYVLHVNYLAPTNSTYYTKEDLQYMLNILNGLEEGVKKL